MQQMLELVHTEGSSEVWRPVDFAADSMQVVTTPQLGDFMIDQNGQLNFLRPEVKRVRIKNVTGDQLQIDLGPNEVPRWFSNLMHTRQIQMRGDKMYLNNQEIKSGAYVVFDGQVARVEESSSEIVTHH